MEKAPSQRQSPLAQQFLSQQEWEALIEDFQSGDSSRQLQWLSKFPSPLSLLNLALASLLRRDFPLKPLLVFFLEEFGHLLVSSPQEDAVPALSALSETLEIVLQSPADSGAAAYALKEQMMVAVTSIAIAIDGLDRAPRQLEAVVEILLAVINHPNHSPDRQARSIACDCLRELEKAYPCLLSEIVGHLWNLCQSERTHASQSYILLLTTVVHNIVQHSMPPATAGILSTSVQLVPFNVPANLNFVARNSQDLSDENLRDIRKVMAFLLERPLILTQLAIAEMVFLLTRVVKVLEAQMSAAAALLKVQFSGLLYSYDPMLCHVVLMLYSHFSDAFSSDEREIARRLTLLPKEAQQPVVYRLLALHWLLGIAYRPPDKKDLLISMASSFYPSLFDPLALKAAKLDVLALIAASLGSLSGEEEEKDEKGESKVEETTVSPVKLFQDSLVCVSAFKWLPPWSTETLVVFRLLHRFLTGAVSGTDSDNSAVLFRMESSTFCTLQSILIDMVVEHPGLVPVVAAFLDRLKCGSRIHVLLGVRLLQTFDESLLPKLDINFRTSSYFSLLERIAENDEIPPHRLLQFLFKFATFLVTKHGPDSGLRLWSKGSKLLRICRTVMMRHNSSRIFNPLSHLLSFISQCYPDLEVRDSARIYLRMLACIPGKKLRHLLNPGEQIPAVAPSPHAGFFYQEKALTPSSFIHLERECPLLLKQSWSLTIPNHGAGVNRISSLEPIREAPPHLPPDPDEFARISLMQEPLRVVDSRAAEILHTLRQHFNCIPDLHYMKGLKIKISCRLSFDGSVLSQISRHLDGRTSSTSPPALYAVVLSFSSTAKYGEIPSRRVPFLLGEAPGSHQAIVAVEETPLPVGRRRKSRSAVVVELEPQEPMPGLVNVTIQANAEDGRLISGQLDGIPVGIEDMFMKAPLPVEISEAEAPRYFFDLFNALWEACSGSSSTGREIFSLRGGRGVAAINGTGSVKLIYAATESLITAVQRHLAPFVVSVSGGALVGALEDGGGTFIPSDDDGNATAAPPLQLEYLPEGDNGDGERSTTDFRDSDLGAVLILIFLPPRFHLLFRMEVSERSTLVRMRTDHWPSLAYVDEFLECVFLS